MSDRPEGKEPTKVSQRKSIGAGVLSPSASIASDLIPKLRLLVAMSERGHLSAAAEAAGVPQPTATRWLAALSRAVGVPLTRRAGQRVELTRAGWVLAESVRAAHSALAVGVARAYEASDPGQGQVVFGFLPTLGVSRAPQMLRTFRATHPRVRLTLIQAPHEQLITRLHDGTIDIALTVIRNTDHDIQATEMFKEPYVVVIPSEHRLARHDYIRLHQIRDEPFVGLTPGIALRTRIDEMFRTARIRPRYILETDEVETVRGLATAGVGIAILPARQGGPLNGSTEIPVIPRTYRHIGLLISIRQTLEPAARRFHQWTTQHGTDGRHSTPVLANGYVRG
jgi:DNA-binding transcriptional LysR family regulator